MCKWDQIQQLQLWTLPAGLLAVAALLWRGYLSRDALPGGCRHRVGLTAADLAVGLGMMAIGGSIYQLIASQILEFEPGASAVQNARFKFLGQILGYAPPAVYVWWRATRIRRGLRRVGLLPRRPAREILMGSMGVLISVPVVLALLTIGAVAGILMDRPPPEVGHALLETLRSTDAPEPRILICVSAIVLAPLLEEMIYRGLLQSVLIELLGRTRRWMAVLLAAGLFALTHLGAAAPHAIPALLALGILLGWLYERSGSLWPPIIAHAAFNTFNIAMALFLETPK